jgi:hypothetical protein
MLKIVAQLLSYLFHPLLMPTWLFGTMMFYFPSSIQPAQAWLLIIILIFGMTFILPLLNMLFFRMTGTIQNFQLPERKDRVLPFIFITIVYVGTSMIFWKMNFPIVFKLMVVISGLSFMVTILTFFFKISVHAVASSGIVGILLAITIFASVGELIIPALAILIIAGMVMSARLHLNVHNGSEVGWGGVLGFLVGFLGVGILF